MSIASEITRLQTSKADSKAQINIDKDIINDGIDFINNEKVDSYNEKIAEMQDAYKQYIPINSTSDTQIEAPKGGAIIGKTIKGNTTQDGTPTPDAPIDVNVVTGEQVVRVCKKNLFDKNTEVTIGKYYNGTGDVVNDSSNTLFIQTFYINVLPNTRYNFSANGNDYFRMCEYTIDKVFIQRQLSNTGNTNTYYFITSPNTYFIRVSCAVSNINSLQIEKGTSTTSYEPYQGKDYEVNLGNIELNKIGNYQDSIRKGTGKNILNLPNRTYTDNGVSYSCVNQEITLNNTATANSFINVFNSGEYLHLKKGTYTISANNPTSAGGSSGQNVIRLADKNGSNVVSASVCTMNVANATATFTITEEKDYIIQVRTQSGTSYTNFKLRPQLEERKSSDLLRTLWL